MPNNIQNNKEFNIINHARKSLLHNRDETWMKKSSNLFDVTMGAIDRAKVCMRVTSWHVFIE